MASPAVASAAGTGPRMLNASTGQGRVVLISGATSDGGFGSTCGKLLAAHGARIVLTDLPVFDERGKALAAEIEKEGGRAAWFPLDVTKEEQWTKAVEFTELTYGPLDVLLNNAGIGFEYADYMRSLDASISQHPTSDWRNMMAINLDGFYFGIKAGAASMEKNPVPEGKSIINFSSVAGLTGMTGMTYTTTKWAVRGLTKHAALFLAPKNIRVNSVHPTYFDTPLLDRALRDPALDPAIQQANLARLEQAQPMNRLGNPIEVANLILYLASTESSFTWVRCTRCRAQRLTQ
ncbi:short-chain dehydrogenase/reductase SDR [Hyaloraphidium curvatum]|nr:short-chain dehydrogenase/reductase SDR [Hyaloraphidium curvatum]